MNKRIPWDDITPPSASNVSKLGAAPDHPHDFYWAKNHLGNFMFLFDIKEIDPDLSVKKIFPGTQGIALDFKRFDKSPANYLVLDLRSNVDADLFYTLCNDLMDSTKKYENTNDAFSIIHNRLVRWSKFLKKGGRSLLSGNEIQGLFCELEFLKFLMLDKGLSSRDALNCWEGPDKESQDFVFSSSVVEIKSITNKNKNKVRISSENQLSTDHRCLFMRVYSVVRDNVGDEGKSLRAQVQELYSLIADLDLRESFEDKLFQVGYMDLKEYEQFSYIINGIRDYEISSEFPRITPEKVSDGILNVTYDLLLSSIERFRSEGVITK
ncbi:MAG: PD-(D/E)XK motif protein [Alphaproteobacteria bacterium]